MVHLAPKIDPSNGKSLSWERPLHYAIRSNTMSLLTCLIEAGADVNLVDSNGRSALSLALYRRSKEAAGLLLRQEASFDRASSEPGKPPLLAKAIKLLSPSALDCLDISNPCNDIAAPRGKLILAEALHYDRWDIVQSLVKNIFSKAELGGIINEAGIIHKAIYQGKKDMVEWLIQNGADPAARIYPGSRDKDKWFMPLHTAAEKGDVEIARVLLRHGADLLSPDSGGVIPWAQSMAWCTDAKPLRWFFKETLKRLPELETVNQRFTLAGQGLDEACRAGLVCNIMLALDFGDVGPDDDPLLTGSHLIYAVRYGRKEATEYLLTQGCDLYTIGTINNTDVTATTVPFREAVKRKNGKQMYPANSLEDYNTCKKLVEDARDRRGAEIAVKATSIRVAEAKEPAWLRPRAKDARGRRKKRDSSP